MHALLDSRARECLDFGGTLHLEALGRKRIGNLALRASAGVVLATDPNEDVDALKARADSEQVRAKKRSRADHARPSVLAGPDSLEDIPFAPSD